MGLSLQNKSTEPTNLWPPADLHARGWIDEAGVRVVSKMGSLMHRACGPGRGDGFGILMYHRIADSVPGRPRPSINVAPETFRKQIVGLLERGFVFWRLSKILEFRRRGWTVYPWVSVITFDDGFQGVYHHAWPVLKDLNVPATVFLNTAYLDSESPFPFDHWARANLSAIPAASYRPLTTAQCREMSADGLIELGAHTHTHQDFRGRPDDFREDLRTNIDALRSRFRIKQPPFSFPYGTPRMGFTSEELVTAARETGVNCGLTTENSLIERDTSPFQWGRIHAFPWDDAGTLAAKLAGWYSWGPRLRHRISRAAPVRTMRSVLPQTGRREPPTTQCGSTESPRTVPSVRPLISVIVPTLNRADWLQGALDSLNLQRTEERFDFEILVVDNASSDNTREVVERTARREARAIRYLFQSKPGDAPTRNRGCEAAAGEWIAFFDDDQLAEPNWLLELFQAAQASGAAIVGGPVHLELNEQQLRGLGPHCRQHLRETKLYRSLRPYAKRHLPGTGNALVARHVIDEVGAFDESLVTGGSDFDFFRRARAQGYGPWYAPQAVIRHRVSSERLSAEYLRWDALSGGARHAERLDYPRGGLAALLPLCLARLALALCLHVPLWCVACLSQNAGEALGRRARLWRVEGYLRKTLALAAPRLLSQREFFEALEFRGKPTHS